MIIFNKFDTTAQWHEDVREEADMTFRGTRVIVERLDQAPIRYSRTDPRRLTELNGIPEAPCISNRENNEGSESDTLVSC